MEIGAPKVSSSVEGHSRAMAYTASALEVYLRQKGITKEELKWLQFANISFATIHIPLCLNSKGKFAHEPPKNWCFSWFQ